MAEPDPADVKQQEAHGQRVKEKAAREQQKPPLPVWPHDAEGNPMAIVTGAASDLIPTVAFGNVCVGPVTIMRPVPNHENIDDLVGEARKVQKAAEFVVASERRLIQWAMDPSSKLEKPSEQQQRSVNEVAPPPPGS